MKITLFIISLLGWQTILFPQSLHFQSYSSAQGLSQNSIYSIAQTNDGFMWFGTQDGLNRFDGKSFTSIIPVVKDQIKNGVATSKISKMITALYADKDDWLWVGTTYEILLYNRYNNSFILPEQVFKGFKLPDGIWVVKIEEDIHHNIWILTQKDGLFCYNKSLKAMVSLNWKGGMIKKIIAFCFDDKGGIWACSQNTLFKLAGVIFTPLLLPNQTAFSTDKTGIADMTIVNGKPWILLNNAEIILANPGRNNIINTQYFTKEFIGRKNLNDARIIHQSDSITVWIGGRSDGLLKINLKTKTFENAGAAETIHSLKTPFVLSFFTNDQKITWIGLSGGGIAKYDLQKIQFSLWRNETRKADHVPDNIIFSIFSENDEDFFMGTLSGGLLHTNVRTGKYSYHHPNRSKHNESGSNNMYEIIKGKKDFLWIATWGGLYSFNKSMAEFIKYTDENDEQTKKLCAIIKLKTQDKILVGGYEGGLRLFDLKTLKWEKCKDEKMLLDNAQFKLRVRYMKEMNDGNIYMSTEAKNLVRYNYTNGQFTFFPQFEKISGASRYFFQDSIFLWVATDDGLIQASAATQKIIKLWTTENGLPNNYIYAVVPDNYGRIWISSNGGLAVIDQNTGICKKFTEDDGLQSMEFNTASCYKDKKGNIWFGGINGLNMVNPELSAIKDFSPPPLITNIQVMNTPYQTDSATPYLQNITLPYTKNFISFEFQTPNFSQSENIIYQYKLAGVDTGWVSNGTKNVARYTQLKPGEYTFYVRSANTNYVWSKSAQAIQISIIPPWYNTWWFYTLLVLSSISFLIIFVSQRIKSIRYKAAVKEKILETEMAALKAQMNPHFMFNCINSIDAFIHSNDKYNATLYLNKFAKLLRNILDSSKQNTVLLSKDVETLKLYVELEELRHEQKFTSYIEVDQELLNSDYKIPPLIIQPFVENAILHGLKNKADNEGKLFISVKKTGDKIKFIIEDNGIGRQAASQIVQTKESSYGIDMSKERIKLFNKEIIASVDMQDLSENGRASGTRIVVFLKVN